MNVVGVSNLNMCMYSPRQVIQVGATKEYGTRKFLTVLHVWTKLQEELSLLVATSRGL